MCGICGIFSGHALSDAQQAVVKQMTDLLADGDRRARRQVRGADAKTAEPLGLFFKSRRRKGLCRSFMAGHVATVQKQSGSAGTLWAD